MKIKKRECIVCGEKYEYCNSCKDNVFLPSWMTIYHDENCRTIMNVATEYMAGNITKTDAKNKLDKCDLKNKKSFKESVLKAINDIYFTKKTNKVEILEQPDFKIEEKIEIKEAPASDVE